MDQTSSRQPPSGPGNRERKGLSLNDRLGLIGLIDEGMRQQLSNSPIVPDLFSDLWDLVSATVSGSRIDRLKPEESKNGYHVFEINSETGENLGTLNMLYLKKPVPCYYLVYVEVAVPFRRNGLGNRVLEHFRHFLIQKSAVGILNNIIPPEDPTYGIYDKQAWEPIESVVGQGFSDLMKGHMIYIPPRFQGRDLRESMVKLAYHLKRKQAVMGLRDNEMMVRRTIAEFKDLYSALKAYFVEELRSGSDPLPLMCFMFTRFVTKLIAFRRRIGNLLGYTGGESLEQITLPSEIRALRVHSYAPPELSSQPSFVTGDKKLWLNLPKALKSEPARFIESLPNYQRPTLLNWLKEKGVTSEEPMTIGDLMDLGFDPTRLKEFTLDGQAFIFERMQARQIHELKSKKGLLELMASEMRGMKLRHGWIRANPPLLVIRDRGNAYVLRRKIGGIHWGEAVEQLQSSPPLKMLNTSLKIDRLIMTTVREANESVAEHLKVGEKTIRNLLTCFVSWDLRTNRPKLIVDSTNTFLESVWMA
jgi:hypothetical protein